MSKHTPGPWVIQESSKDPNCIVIKTNDDEVIASAWNLLNMLPNGQTTVTDNEANAILIASAPDLLTALVAITPHVFGHNKPSCKGKVRDPKNCDVCKAIWLARDAIAKATGK